MKQIIRKELVLLKDLGMLYPNKTAEEGARAYDKYVIDNNLEHPTNFKREDN